MANQKPGKSLADFQKKVDAARGDVTPYALDLNDGADPVTVKDPTQLGIGTMSRVLNAEESMHAQGLLAFEALFSQDDFARLLKADPPMGVVAAVMDDVVEHYGVPAEGESSASRG